jgi:hypothetical protein
MAWVPLTSETLKGRPDDRVLLLEEQCRTRFLLFKHDKNVPTTATELNFDVLLGLAKVVKVVVL